MPSLNEARPSLSRASYLDHTAGSSLTTGASIRTRFASPNTGAPERALPSGPSARRQPVRQSSAGPAWPAHGRAGLCRHDREQRVIADVWCLLRAAVAGPRSPGLREAERQSVRHLNHRHIMLPFGVFLSGSANASPARRSGARDQATGATGCSSACGS